MVLKNSKGLILLTGIFGMVGDKVACIRDIL
jgi:hypothetical protein